MTFLATCVAFCHMSLSQAAAEATHEAIDLSVPWRGLGVPNLAIIRRRNGNNAARSAAF